MARWRWARVWGNGTQSKQERADDFFELGWRWREGSQSERKETGGRGCRVRDRLSIRRSWGEELPGLTCCSLGIVSLNIPSLPLLGSEALKLIDIQAISSTYAFFLRAWKHPNTCPLCEWTFKQWSAPVREWCSKDVLLMSSSAAWISVWWIQRKMTETESQGHFSIAQHSMTSPTEGRKVERLHTCWDIMQV